MISMTTFPSILVSYFSKCVWNITEPKYCFPHYSASNPNNFVMSFRVPPVHKWQSLASPSKSTPLSLSHFKSVVSTSQSHQLVEHHLLPQQRQAYGTKGLVMYQEELLVEPHHLVFTQPLSVAQLILTQSDLEHPYAIKLESYAQPLCIHFFDESPDSYRLSACQKKEHQWAKLGNKVIPSLVWPYIQHLYATWSLRDPLQDGWNPQNTCSCHKEMSLTVTCVYFHHMWMFN